MEYALLQLDMNPLLDLELLPLILVMLLGLGQ